MPESNIYAYLLNTASKEHWRKSGLHKRAGVVVPLFSVYSQKSLGIGDLGDLKLLIDWASLTGNSIIQLLPMNEIGTTFCPYDSISSFALEPVYISLEAIAGAQKKPIKTRIEDIRKTYPAGQAHVDYRIKKEKLRLARDIFNEAGDLDNEDFKNFIQENSHWIKDFVLFKVLKDCQEGRAWYEWEERYKGRDASALRDFQKEHEREILFQMWMQWHLYKQFREAKKYAESKNILIKGDLPILVSRDSADVWARPEFFKLNFASGAPPDMYCAKGQRWGTPTYDWDRIKADDFRYIKEKFKYAQNFYEIIRIDHVVGLFRIWSIPYNEPSENQGLNGVFDPKDEKEWEGHGKGILSVMFKSSDMLLCAEDLGVIPKACPKVLKELGIPGNDVQRWTKEWKIKHDFLKPQDYRDLSVAMLSTHDTTNWPAWWENEAGTVDEALFIRKCSDHRKINFSHVKDKLFDSALSGHGRLRWLNSVDSTEKLVSILGKKKEELADFIEMYENSYQEKEKLWKHLNLKGPMREKSDPQIMLAALKISLESKAIFCINTIVDYLYLTGIFKGDPYQYRINTPGTLSEKNWSLVIPIALEELLKHKVNTAIRNMIVASGRI